MANMAENKYTTGPVWVVAGDTWAQREALKTAGCWWLPDERVWAFEGSYGTAAAQTALTARLVAEMGFDVVPGTEEQTAEYRRRRAGAALDPEAVAAALTARTLREVIDLGRTLGGGTLGTDPARVPAAGGHGAGTKGALVAYLIGRHGAAAVAAAMEGGAAPAAIDESGAAAAAPSPVPTSQWVPSGATVATAAEGPIEKALREVISGVVARSTPALDEERVRDIVTEALAEMPQAAARVTLDLTLGGAALGSIPPTAHPATEKVVRLLTAGENVLLVGPAGAGKTHLAESVGAALGLDFATLSLTAGVTESKLTGRLLPLGDNGTFRYVASPFVRVYENGGLFLFDEIDAADPNMLLTVNTALSNGHIEIDERAASALPTRVTRHEKTMLLGAANTVGTGADAMYVGRGQLDAATLDRWYLIVMDYDVAYEASLFGGDPSVLASCPAGPWTAADTTDTAALAAEVRALGEWVWSVRALVNVRGLRRTASSRMTKRAVRARCAGVPFEEVRRDLVAGWTQGEREMLVAGGLL